MCYHKHLNLSTTKNLFDVGPYNGSKWAEWPSGDFIQTFTELCTSWSGCAVRLWFKPLYQEYIKEESVELPIVLHKHCAQSNVMIKYRKLLVIGQ